MFKCGDSGKKKRTETMKKQMFPKLIKHEKIAGHILIKLLEANDKKRIL